MQISNYTYEIYSITAETRERFDSIYHVILGHVKLITSIHLLYVITLTCPISRAKEQVVLEIRERMSDYLIYFNDPNTMSVAKYYRKTANISRTLIGNKIVDNSDVVWASPVGTAPTTSSFST